MDVIAYKGKTYPKLQAEGFAAQYAFPFASKILSGRGLDIGSMKPEWAFPGATPVDIAFDDDYDAYNLPEGMYDYCFSSHLCEHLPDWTGALDYWASKLWPGGHIFLFLPNCDVQQYWQPANNRKHLHHLNPAILQAYFDNRKDVFKNVFVTTGADLNASFYAVAQKK
jgi:SAM-dependent methyltransferase